MVKNSVLIALQEELRKAGDEKTRRSTKRFFKENVSTYGVKTALVHKLSKRYFQFAKEKPKNEIFEWCEELWKSGYLEESIIASNWSFYLHKHYEPGDFSIFERWIRHYVHNWASCDTFCNHSMGVFLEMYPEFVSALKKWAESGNRWIRRAAAVSLIIPAKKGKFLPEIFSIADILLLDEDDLVQKGYGWMLKVASQVYPEEVFDYVVKNKTVMPRTALRYAIEKMTQDRRKKAMEKD